MNLHQSFWKLTKEIFTVHEVNFGGAAKISTIFINNVTYHPVNPDADVTYQTVNLFSSDKCFTYFISDVPHYIRWYHHNTVCTILVKVDVLNTCGAVICLYFGIAFLLFFMKIENTFYTSSQNSMLLFINGLIFGIMNIQNNQSLEFEWIPMLRPRRSVNDQSFSWLRNVFPRLAEFCSAMSRKLYKIYWPEDVHIMANISYPISSLTSG